MPEHIHDCIVEGAGPAGSAVTLEMARSGLDFVMLERSCRSPSLGDGATACQDRPWAYVCPANLYQWLDGQMVHTCEG